MLYAPSVQRRLDHLAAGWRPWLLLTLLSLALFVPGLVALPPIDRDEARYIQATRQMLESGDFLRIRFQDEARNKKPAGVYWLQSAAVAALSDARSSAVWPYRLVSLCGATLAVVLTFAFGAAIFDRRTAFIGAALLAATADLVFEAHVATTDAVLLPAAVAAQGALGLAYLGFRRGEAVSPWVALVFWLAEAAALLIKGPVVPVLSAITALVLVAADRRGRWLLALRPLWGVPLVLAMVLPWLWLIERETGGAFLREAVGHDFIGKLTGGQEAHGAPPGYYLALLPVTFWPASLFLGVAALWAWRSRRLPASRLLAAWIVPFWIVLELVPTKLPHYVLPLYPALALACARALVAIGEEGMGQPPVWLRILFPTLWALVGLALGGTLLFLPPLLGLPAMAGGGVAAAVAAAVAWQVLANDRCRFNPASAAICVLAAVMVLASGFELVLPRLDPVWLSRSAAGLVAAERHPAETVSATGYAEPSLVFLLGTDTRLLSAGDAALALAEGKIGLALVSGDEDAAFNGELGLLGITPHLIDKIRGFDYSNGRWLTLSLYRKAAAAAAP